jgi:hypothetical protein
MLARFPHEPNDGRSGDFVPLRGLGQAHARNPVADNSLAVDVERRSAELLPLKFCPPHPGLDAFDDQPPFEFRDAPENWSPRWTLEVRREAGCRAREPKKGSGNPAQIPAMPEVQEPKPPIFAPDGTLRVRIR